MNTTTTTTSTRPVSSNGVELVTPTLTSYIKDLVFTDLSYKEILAEIMTVFPTANTTVKSIATVVRDMRKAGVTNIPTRGVRHEAVE